MTGCRLGKDRNETRGNQETLQIKLSLWNTETLGGNMMSPILS